ncbi:MAG: alpha/beta fold hydrolase [Actinobacteria bacterium]|uniref:Unannotated protein n=1 Tax=freshwater metagenome TaxID=449393 RepID=A0A6J5YFH9_9ZZZZ|nr:alpha/beta fold hydrolase [Actinomycetota bacterium]
MPQRRTGSTDRPEASDWERWGVDPAWNRRVTLTTSAGTVEWSILDTGHGSKGTIVCVHGNPTWGYLWRNLLRESAHGWRVIAVDQTGMGWSQRAGSRTLEQRVEELVAFCQQEAPGPLILAAHDWGGPVAMGAAGELDVRAVVLTNTAVAKPQSVSVPPLIAVARSAVGLTCARTPLFVRGTSHMTDRSHREALNAPYRSAARRSAVADFVADIPLQPNDTSFVALERSASNFEALRSRSIPVLLLWGGSDPVFHDRFLADLLTRAPHADVHRFADAGHLVALDEPIGPMVTRWLDTHLANGTITLAESANPAAHIREPHEPTSMHPVGEDSTDFAVTTANTFSPITTALMERASDPSCAYEGPDGARSWSALNAAAERIARRLVRHGVQPGDRIALLVPPGIQLLEAVHGAWRAGAVVVIADSALGASGLRSAFRSATPAWVIGTPKNLLAAKILRMTPGAGAFSMGRLPGAVDLSGSALRSNPNEFSLRLPNLDPDSAAAVVHTSGATGPAKPVVYTHAALAAQRDVVREAFTLDPAHGFISSFAPFILLGPALGVPCVLPEGDVLAPAELDFDQFADACRSSDSDVAWLSPASARTIVRTANGRQVPLRLVMLAGAPIPLALAEDIHRVTSAEVRAPYGMTEAMPVTDGIGAMNRVPWGTDTGRALSGAEIIIVPFREPRLAQVATGCWGEILVSCPWMRSGYDRRWGVDESSTIERDGKLFHRTGDVGAIDDQGHLIQLGRVQHVITTATQALPCAVVEQSIADQISAEVAAVGVGPDGAQVVVVVVSGTGSLRTADSELTADVRAASPHSIAAVLIGELPVDIRHQSKIRRDVLAESAAELLAGR